MGVKAGTATVCTVVSTAGQGANAFAVPLAGALADLKFERSRKLSHLLASIRVAGNFVN